MDNPTHSGNSLSFKKEKGQYKGDTRDRNDDKRADEDLSQRNRSGADDQKMQFDKVRHFGVPVDEAKAYLRW